MNDKFYSTGKWRRKREKILKRDKYLCVECKRYGRTDKDGNPIVATTVHHKIKLEDEPALALADSNLESLCEGCHNKRHPERSKKKSPPFRY